jgi:hypothetical protein
MKKKEEIIKTKNKTEQEEGESWYKYQDLN